MTSRIFKTAFLPVVATLACAVDVDVESEDAIAPAYDNRSAPTPSAEVIAMAQDPLYHAHLVASTQRAGVMLEHLMVPAWHSGDGGAEQVFHRWANYRKALSSLGIDPNAVTNADAPVLTEATGVPLAQIATAIDRIEELDERYGFLSMSHAEHAIAVNLALSNVALVDLTNDTWGDESVLIEIGADSLDPCVVECVEQSGETWLVVSAGVYVAAEQFEALDLDVVFIAVEGAVLAVTAAAFEQCVDECGVEIEEQCQEDWECEPKEYCDRGWLTIGENQCVFSRDEGDICTRAEQCETGCCKYHGWSNPVHPVCRPANKCD
jgi:hypothetical protein